MLNCFVFSEESEVTPIDKKYAAEQIEQGGGIVCQTFDKSQVSKKNLKASQTAIFAYFCDLHFVTL